MGTTHATLLLLPNLRRRASQGVWGGIAGSRRLRCLLGPRQGSRSVVDYAIDFRIQFRLSEWNQAAQVDAFLLGLADYVRDELVSLDWPSSLEDIIVLYMCVVFFLYCMFFKMDLESNNKR